MNQKPSVRSMVRSTEPSTSSATFFTKSRKRRSSMLSTRFLTLRDFSNFFSSSHALLIASQASIVSAVRTARAFVRAFSEAIVDRRWVFRLEHEEAHDRGLVDRVVQLLEGLQRVDGAQRAFPFARRVAIGARQRDEPRGRIEDAGRVIRPFDVASEPVQAVGGAREHHIFAKGGMKPSVHFPGRV